MLPAPMILVHSPDAKGRCIMLHECKTCGHTITAWAERDAHCAETGHPQYWIILKSRPTTNAENNKFWAVVEADFRLLHGER